ncbi:PII-type proteinase precursor [Clostridium tepidiprofundi DSM 19306]|uniref:PII-type proteinase n=1 Tax=Clostridium tepidiprofundi DSM 19306 TaxID=1121338 RepID=A0A151B2Z8_9CLOT|nr:S8 family serine peptidase [Clostridium tepidiprofundi]KYH34288.1 PII-type proteinase precursor [Clostridium tepidiprofundi DSM 19306]
MRYKHKKLMSIIMTFVMIFGLVFTPSMKVFADNNKDMHKNLYKGEELTISKEVKDKIYEEARKQLRDLKHLNSERKYNSKNSRLKYFNDNVPNKGKKQHNPEDKVRLIVELNGKSVKDYCHGRSLKAVANNSKISQNILKTQNSTINEVLKHDPNIKLENRYSVLLNGFSVEAKYKDLNKIAEMPGVKSVQVANEYYPDMNYAKDMKTNIANIWKDYGYKGEGMVVSIIDTGIDYKHKDMVISSSTTPSAIKLTNENPKGPGIYFTEKVPYGHNFADDNQDVIPAPGTSPHGMHVAGIVGANCQEQDEINKNEGIKGVAPECQLLAMKVFSNKPGKNSAYSDDIIAAIEDSVLHGADVINMSLGSTAAFQDMTDGEQTAVREATENGVVVVISAGNSQYSTAPYKFPNVKDTGLVGSPGLAHESMQVASFENNRITSPGLDYTWDGGSSKEPVAYAQCSIDPVEALNDPNGYEVVYCGLGGTPAEFAGKDLHGKIALIKRGKYAFTVKQSNAKAAGAIGVIVYNNKGNALVHMVEQDGLGIPALFIGETDGAKINSLIGKNVRIKFNGKITSIINPDKGDMSDFTSWGPTPNLDFKPQITGVGGDVWSTIPNNKYESMSGTSMASPYVAGCTALIMQHINDMIKEGKLSFENPDEKAEFVKALAINTAEVKMDKYHHGTPYSPRRQGAGLVDTEAAIKDNVTITYNGEAVAALKEMGETTEIPLVVHNYGDKTITYKVEDLSGVMTEQGNFLPSKDTGYTMSYDVPLKGASITFDKDTITVTTGSSITINATINMSDDTPVDNFAEGFIRLIPQDSDVPDIGIPYMGFYGDWDELPILDAPMYDGKTKLGEGSLFTINSKGNIYYLGVVGYDKYGNPIVEPKDFAINPDDEDANTNVLPIVTLLRNAKDFEVNIKDSNGELIKTVAESTNLRKEVLAEQPNHWYTTSEDWAWDGKEYDPSTGGVKSVPEGQYYVSLKSKIDFEGARYQELSMPVKVDKTKPVVNTDEFFDESPTEDYKVSFKASDNMTDIHTFAILIKDFASNKSELYENDGHKIFNASDYYNKETGKYEMSIKLPYHANIVAPVAIDYAGNMGMGYSIVINTAKDSQIEITSPESYSLVDEGDVKLEYKASDKLMSELDHFVIKIDDDDEDNRQVIKNDKKLEYVIKGLEPGKHVVKVEAANKDETKVLDSDSIIFSINGKDLSIKFDNLGQGSVVNKTTFTLEGSVTSIPEKFEINGKTVKLGVKEEISGNINPLAFKHDITLKAGELNKVYIYVKSKSGKEYNYAYNVYCDTDAPVITLTNPKQSIDDPNREVYEVIVDKNANSYTVTGKVKDNMQGYKFFINGSQVLNVEYDTPRGDDTEREFSREIKLNSPVTIIKLKAVDFASNTTVRTIKVYRGEKTNPIAIENLTGDKTFHNGDQVKIQIKATNITDKASNASLILGLFDENGAMVNVVASSQKLASNDEVVMMGILNIPEEGKYKLKAFVWNSFDSMNPLSDVIEYDIK